MHYLSNPTIPPIWLLYMLTGTIGRHTTTEHLVVSPLHYFRIEWCYTCNSPYIEYSNTIMSSTKWQNVHIIHVLTWYQNNQMNKCMLEYGAELRATDSQVWMRNASCIVMGLQCWAEVSWCEYSTSAEFMLTHRLHGLTLLVFFPLFCSCDQERKCAELVLALELRDLLCYDYFTLWIAIP